MIVGLTYDLKEDLPHVDGQPEDAFEEYDSRETVDAIARVIESLGHSVVRLGGGRKFLASILENQIDFVFNISEGRGTYRSREAQVPSVLEMLDIPYTGSDPECLAICLDKPLTKKIVAINGINTPQWLTIDDQKQLSETNWDKFPFPSFIKLAYEGSSKGVRFSSRVENPEQATLVIGEMLERYHQTVMVEEFISGDEITVGIVGNSPATVAGIMRILPRKKDPDFIYSLEVKRDWENLVDYECPAKLEDRVLKELYETSLKAYKVLDCRDFARLDFRVDARGKPYFLEINPLAGLNPRSSDLCLLVYRAGWTYQSLIAAIFESAVKRYRNAD